MCTINIGSEQEELDMKRSHMRQTFMTAPKTNTTTSFFGKMYFNGRIIIIIVAVVLSKLVRYVQVGSGYLITKMSEKRAF